jgi:peptide/nickel transport system substrate-binding protein
MLKLSRRALLATALAAPAIARAEPSRVLRFAPQSDVTVLDPLFTQAYVTRNHALMVFDQLYGLDAQFRPQPQMVAGHEIAADGLIWTLTLREGLRFHDGAQVLARDCVASIRRWGVRDSYGQTLMAVTDELSAPDDRRIVFRLKRPFALLADALAKPGSNICAIMPERLAATDPFKQVTEMVGSGPFRFNAAERLAGARVVYDRNEAYVPAPGPASFTAGAKLVHFDRVIWQVMPDPSTASSALQAGEIDWWENPSPDLLAPLRRAGVTIVQDPSGYIGTLRLNHLQAPFNNPAIRRALLGAINQEDYMLAAAGDEPGLWRKDVGFFPPGTPSASGTDMTLLSGPRDLERVKAELISAGYKGERVVLPVPTDFPSLKALGDVGADMLRKIGMNVEYKANSWGGVLSQLNNMESVEQGGWSVFHTYWAGLDLLNPAVNGSLRGTGKLGGRGWPTSQALEDLRNAWLAAPDEATQRRIAADIQHQAFQDVPYIPIGQFLAPQAYRRNIVDVSSGFAQFWGVRRA